MSIQIVIQQMAIIFILIFTGAFLYKKEMLSDHTSRQISGLIVNLCNPALLISSVFESGEKVSGHELITGTLIVLLAYVLLILCSYLIPILLRAPKEEYFAYRLLTIFGNVGFIGIPLASAVLGSGSLIYVSLNNLIYNILMYTYGTAVIKKAQEKEKKVCSSSLLPMLKSSVNAGTVSAVLTIVLYVCDFNIPAVFSNTFSYIGRSTTLLSMLVLGVSVAQTPLADIFRCGRLYLFNILRLILIPIGCIFLFRIFTDNTLIIYTTVLLLAVPAGNMPLIISRQHGVESETISKGIILSTLLALVTIPIVMLFV